MKDNGLIAEFMGWKQRICTFGGRDYWWHSADSKIIGKGTWSPCCEVGHEAFEHSWDWLMFVVDKINKDNLFHHDNAFTVRIDKHDVKIFQSVMRIKKIIHIEWMSDKDTMLSMTYRAVVEFIRWYNNKINVM